MPPKTRSHKQGFRFCRAPVESGAVLLAGSNMEDYCAEDAYEQNFGVPDEEWSGGHCPVFPANSIAVI